MFLRRYNYWEIEIYFERRRSAEKPFAFFAVWHEQLTS